MGTASIILVGGTGRVGRMLVPHWPFPDRLQISRRSRSGAGGGLVWSPLDGPAALLDHLSRTGTAPQAMIVLAGVTPAPGVDAAAMQGNSHLAVACLHAARAAGIGRVLLASSSAVYGVDPEGAPFAEGAPLHPLNAYGRAKQAMEAAALPFRAQGIDVCCLRIGNVAGADALLHPLSAAMDALRQPVRIDAFADGLGPLRSYIGPQTMARLLARLAELPAPLPEVLNFAAPNPVRMVALARAAGWPVEMVPAPAQAHQSITLDCAHLARLCPMMEKDSDPADMVAQWKATLTR